MSGLEVMGIYLVGVILGGLLGLMIARRLYGRRKPPARPLGLIARWGQRFRRASSSGSPEAETSGESCERGEGMLGREGRPETPGAMRRVSDPDRVAEYGQEGALRSFSDPQRQRKPRWSARWLTRRTVEAEEFVVRDSTGMRRAKLGMSEDGGVRLRLFDKDGVSCVSLGATPNEYARLRLYDQHGALRAGLGVFPEDAGVGVVLNDQAGNPRMTFSLVDSGAAELRILDENSKVLWKTP